MLKPPSPNRRNALATLASALTLCALRPATVQAAGVATGQQPPAPGDALALPSWDDRPRVITPADLVLNAPPLVVYPSDITGKTVRERSRLNQILLVRLSPDQLDAATRQRAADGIVAYTGTCTHAGCSVSEWDASARQFLCPCHSSRFDPAHAGTRVAGPAARPLPALPLKIEHGRLLVAGAFSGKIGAKSA